MGGMDEVSRFGKLLSFVRYIGSLKAVYRQVRVEDQSRKETAAEHSWQVALTACLLWEYAKEDLDYLRVLVMLLVHDLVEIECGDTFVYDAEAMQSKRERELAAADVVFGHLPPPQSGWFRELWEEFEARQTPEARFANALDRMLPMFQNFWAGGGAWQDHGVTADKVLRQNRIIADGSLELWEQARAMVMEAVQRGYLQPGSDYEQELTSG